MMKLNKKEKIVIALGCMGFIFFLIIIIGLIIYEINIGNKYSGYFPKKGIRNDGHKDYDYTPCIWGGPEDKNRVCFYYFGKNSKYVDIFYCSYKTEKYQVYCFHDNSTVHDENVVNEYLKLRFGLIVFSILLSVIVFSVGLLHVCLVRNNFYH